MLRMGSCEPHFIRCIKPNANKVAHQWDKALVLRQLTYTGMLQTVKMRREGYPFRIAFEDFFESYVLHRLLDFFASIGLYRLSLTATASIACHLPLHKLLQKSLATGCWPLAARHFPLSELAACILLTHTCSSTTRTNALGTVGSCGSSRHRCVATHRRALSSSPRSRPRSK